MAESYSVNAVISAVDSNFSSTFRSAAKSVASFQAGTQTGLGRVGATVSKIGGTLTKGITLPLGLMAIAAAKTSMDFNAQMSRVQAISGATGKQMGAMKKQAIDLGAKTAFSAKQAAEGMENLASAGMNSTQIMKAMPGVLNLAAVSGGDVAKAAENMSTALNAFGLSAGKSSHVADVFAKAAAKTNAEASDMGEALKYVAPQAHAAGLSLEETSAAIGLLSDNGLKGSTAGTTLAQALMRVQKPSAEAQKAMSKLGFSAYDSSGKMKPLAKQVSELKGKMKGMTDEQKANTLATIYGMEGGRAMNVLLGEQDGKLAALTKSLKNSKGSAADMAKIMQDNAKSAVEQLGGAFESAAIVIGDKMAPAIKNVANTIAGLVAKFNTASPAVQDFVLALLGIAAAVGPLMMLAGKIMTLTSEFATLAQAAGGLKPLMSGIGKVMSKAFAGVAILAGIMLIVKGFRDLYNTSATFRNIVNSVSSAVGGVLSSAFKVAGAAVQIAVNAFKSLNKSTGGILGPILEIVAGVAMVAKGMQSLGIASTIASTAMKAFGLLSNPWVLLAVAIAAAVAGLVYFFTQTKTGQQIVTTVVAAIQAAWQTLATFMSTLWTGIVTVATAAWNLLVTLMTPVVTAIMAIWQSLSAYFSALWTSIVTVATAAWNLLVTIFTPIIAAIMAAWQVLSPFFAGLFQGIVTIITTVVSVIQTVWEAAWNVISTVASAAWNVITSIVSGALNVIAGIINAVTAAIQGDWSGAWSAIQGVTSTIWNTIKSVVTTGINAVKSVITSVLNAIMSVVTSVWNGIKSVTSSAWNGIKSAISSGINAARSVVSSAVNAMRSSAISAWNAMKSAASSVVSGIKSAFHSLASINLGAAGRAIMNSFLGGLTAAWGKVKSFVSGIAGWIKDHKGPISYDRKLLIPAGAAIMNGLNSGLIDNFKTVRKNVENMGSVISDSMNSQFQLTDTFGSVNTGLNSSSLTGAMEHELNVANNWTVEVPVNLDGKEVAHITAKPMQDELNRMTTQNNRIHGQR